MKIAILGPFSIPYQINMGEILDKNEHPRNITPHPHPWISNLAHGLKKNSPSNEIHVLTMTGSITRDKLIHCDGVFYHLVKSSPRMKRIFTGFKSNKWRMHEVLNEIKPDIVHGQSRGREAYFAITSRYPCVITSHGVVSEEFKRVYRGIKPINYYIARYFERRVNSKLKSAIGVSEYCVNELKKYLEDKDVSLIENSINEVYFSPLPNTYDPVILFVGGITPLKRVLQLVQIIKEIPNCQLRIISNDCSGSYYDDVIRYIEENSLSERVHLLGYMHPSEIVAEMKKSRLLCLPSLFESFGLVIAEAMASGIPVVASKVGGIPNIVKHGKTGLLFNPDNLNELKANIQFLLNNKETAVKMGMEAQSEAQIRWHPLKIAQDTLKVYHSILGKEI